MLWRQVILQLSRSPNDRTRTLLEHCLVTSAGVSPARLQALSALFFGRGAVDRFPTCLGSEL